MSEPISEEIGERNETRPIEPITQNQSIELQPPEVEPMPAPAPRVEPLLVPPPEPTQQSVASQSAPVQPQIATPTNIVLPASIWKRLGNLFIDYFIKVILVTILTVIGSSMGESTSGIFGLLAVIVFLCYELVMESIWQRTIGKFITGTKVVDNFGNKPSFLRILGRSAARLIPFNHFSFLVSKHPRGWHDALSGTLVVSSKLSEAELKSIDVEAIKKHEAGNGAMIVVIVVVVFLVTILIIGVLSSIVLASLSTARAQAQEDHAKATMILFKTQSLLYEEQNHSYLGLCKSPEAASLISSIVKSSKQYTSSDIVCNDSDKAWALSVSKLASSYPGYFCIDNKVRQMVETKTNIGNAVSCPTDTLSTGSSIDIDGMDSVRK